MCESANNDLQLCPATFATLNEFFKKKKEERKNQSKHILKINFGMMKKQQILLCYMVYRIQWKNCNTLYPILYNRLKKNRGERFNNNLYNIKYYIYTSLFLNMMNVSEYTILILRNYKFLLHILGDMSNFYYSDIANPPFLSYECFEKTALIIKLAKTILFCTDIFDNQYSTFKFLILHSYIGGTI
ncbi:hypothetical protein E2986_12477 [Frieseomelitta varia]|uniref:Uncharacterized protein n=1 Tax=Frieseomelitta varia TaxID=561572 RepID=A0A833VX53_9HYME|nr:hypothetical protein E2986_12477 [Frieseomelitta varia]